jgi:DNA polymerase-3 subunit gamma/tau
MEKKKNKHFIIPPSYFKAKGITPIPVKKPSIEVQPSTIQPSEEQEYIKAPVNVKPSTAAAILEPTVPKISINKPSNVTSGLSLKSIREKKEHLIRQMDVVIDEDDLPKEPVTQEALSKAWIAYTAQMDKKGEKIMASILQMDEPKLKETTIYLTYSNNTNKIELERAEFPLMAFLKKALLNYDLKLDITVNEEVAKKYAFTPLEKYEKLKEKNPNIEILRQTFGLDI